MHEGRFPSPAGVSIPHAEARLKASLRLASLGLDPRSAMRTRLSMQAKGSSERQLCAVVLQIAR